MIISESLKGSGFKIDTKFFHGLRAKLARDDDESNRLLTYIVGIC